MVLIRFCGVIQQELGEGAACLDFHNLSAIDWVTRMTQKLTCLWLVTHVNSGQSKESSFPITGIHSVPVASAGYDLTASIYPRGL